MTGPKWEYKSNPVNFNGVNDKFINQLKIIVGFPDEHTEGVKDYVGQMFTIYTLGKETSSRHNCLFPNKGNVKAAAASILTDVNSLLKKLHNEAGGINIYYQTHNSNKDIEFNASSFISDIKALTNYANDKTFDLHQAVRDREGVIGKSTEGLMSELTLLKEVCELIPKEVEAGTGLIPGRTPKQSLVCAIAFLFRDCFHINPSIYVSKDYGKSSQYAEFLSACFMELEGFIPGDLKKLMIWEKKEWEAYTNS